jgi:hypothetical protein
LSWCKSIPKYAFVTKALDLATYQDVAEPQENGSDAVDWKTKAREIADRIAQKRGGGPTKKISARNVSEAVAKELGEHKNPIYCSNRNVPYSESAVRTQALRGWQYPHKQVD